MSVKVAVIYYSATGHVHHLARAVEEGAIEVGAEVRFRKVRELAPKQVIDSTPDWREHLEQTSDVLEATLEDLEWADAYLLGTPTRYGNMSSQLKQFIDTTGGLWFDGKLADKVVSCFTSADSVHGGQETTLVSMYNVFAHWGAIIVPPGYTDPVVDTAGGNPYGVSSTHTDKEPAKEELLAARFQGRRVAETAAAFVRGRG